MKLQDAIQVFGMTGEILEDDAKLQYKRLASKYHPDKNPAGLEMMKAVNDAWQTLQDAFANGWNVQAGETNDENYGDELNEAINAIIDLEGIEIEICGAWVWVTGETKQHKDVLGKNGAGFKFASKKVAWFFRPENHKSKGRGKFSMDDIRAAHGSTGVNKPSRKKIAA